MSTPNPLLLIAELTYRCPLHCPYCSNPVEIGGARYRDELATADWARVFQQAAALGVLQVALTGGEPLVRRDLEQLAGSAAEAGLYSTLVTSAIPFSRARMKALRVAGLDHVQISFQDSDLCESDRMAGASSFVHKHSAAELVTELGFPLTVNVVLHRNNLDRVEEIITLAERLGACRLELANAQYHGWAVINRAALFPTRAQVEAGERAVERARKRLASKMEILWVIPDYWDEYPKPCMGGWGRQAIVVAPNGDALPCHAAATIPGLAFESVRDIDLGKIWFDSEAFNRFRGIDWMGEPCRSCPLGRQRVDFGGCRCQSLQLTGRAEATDPACHLSPDHDLILRLRATLPEDAERPLVYRTTRAAAERTALTSAFRARGRVEPSITDQTR
jgi:pyrroloquinoline quinone biosynthesis protein E